MPTQHPTTSGAPSTAGPGARGRHRRRQAGPPTPPAHGRGSGRGAGDSAGANAGCNDVPETTPTTGRSANCEARRANSPASDVLAPSTTTLSAPREPSVDDCRATASAGPSERDGSTSTSTQTPSSPLSAAPP